MANDELLLALSDMLDKKIQPLEKKLENEIQSVKDEVKLVKDEVKLINLKLENIIEPRLNEIERCYLDTYKRYQYGNDKIEKLELDNQIIRSRIQTHDEILKRNQIA